MGISRLRHADGAFQDLGRLPEGVQVRLLSSLRIRMATVPFALVRPRAL